MHFPFLKLLLYMILVATTYPSPSKILGSCKFKDFSQLRVIISLLLQYFRKTIVNDLI